MTLLYFIALLIRSDFPDINDFTYELIYLDKASSGKIFVVMLLYISTFESYIQQANN